MNKRLETLLERVSAWPEEAQVELARIIDEIERQRSEVYQLSDEEKAAIKEGLAQADRGEFVSDEEMAAFFKRHGVEGTLHSAGKETARGNLLLHF